MSLRLKKFIFAAAVFAGFFFMLGFFKKYHLPRLKRWVAVEIEKYSRNHLPLRIWPQDVRFTVLPLGVVFGDVKITPQKGLEKNLLPFTLKEARLQLSGIGLLKGQLRIGRVTLKGADVRAFIKPNGGDTNLPEIDFEAIYQIPVDEIRVDGVKGGVNSQIGEFSGSVGNFRLRVENRYRSLRIRVDAEQLRLQENEAGKEITFDFSTRFLVDEEGVYFSSVRAKRQDSFLLAAGSVTGRVTQYKFDHMKFKVRSQLKLPEVTLVLRDIFGHKVPALMGRTNFEVDIDHRLGDTDPKADVQFNGEDLAIDRFQIGKLRFTAGLAGDKAVFSLFELRSAAGTVSVEKASIGVKSPFAFTAQVKAADLDIHNLLKQLGIPRVPVYTRIATDLPCEGRIAPPFKVACTGKISDSTVKVTPSVDSDVIITDLEKVAATGDVTVDADKVKYAAKLNIGGSEGTTTGTIIYKKGFAIDFASNAVHFKDVKNLANLNFEGSVGIKGVTEGNASTATLKADLNAVKTRLEDFGLGDFRARMTLQKGVLRFRNVVGHYNQSQYGGLVSLNFNKNTIDVDMKAPFLTLEDVQDLLAKRIPLPVNIDGTGSAAMKLYGPLQLNKLSFQFSSAFFRGSIGGESFDQFHANLMATDGRVQTQRVALMKAGSQIHLAGTLSPQGILDASLTGRNLQLEQSENLAKWKLNLAGVLNVSTKLTGPILRPKVEANGILSNVVVGTQPAPNSSFRFSLDEKMAEGEGSFAGGVLTVKIQLPFNAKEPYAFDLRAKDWDFGRVFSVVDENYRANAFNTAVTSELSISGTQRSIAHSKGSLRIDKFYVRNGPATLQSTGPMSLTLRNGVLAAHDFQLAGEAGIVKLTSRETRPGYLDLALDGKLDLLMVSVLTPFLDDLRGLVTLNLKLTGPMESPDILGSTFLQNGFARLKGFPHALEQVTADVLFSQRRILINSAKGRIAGGMFSANGKIQFSGLTSLPIDIRGQFQDSVFKVPEGFTTRGNGDFFISGDWFPYTVGVNFNVDSGAIEKKLSATTTNTKEVRPSSYLPRFLVEKRFSPVTLDLNVILRNPLSVTMQVPQLEVKATIDGQVKVKGPPEQLLLNGRLNLTRGSRFTLRNNPFELTTGYVEYNNAPPDNPDLNIIAESQITGMMRDNEEREYEVVARVTGTAAKPLIRLSSEPALPEKDLISLLTLGFINENDRELEDSDQDKNARAASAGYNMGSAFVTEQLGINRQLQKSLGVQFDYSSSFDSNDQAQRHTFTLKKQWSPKFGTSASRTIGKTNTNNVKAEYKLKKNISVIGRWEGREQTGATTDDTAQEQENQFGLDIEYRIKFK